MGVIHNCYGCVWGDGRGKDWEGVRGAWIKGKWEWE